MCYHRSHVPEPPGPSTVNSVNQHYLDYIVFPDLNAFSWLLRELFAAMVSPQLTRHITPLLEEKELLYPPATPFLSAFLSSPIIHSRAKSQSLSPSFSSCLYGSVNPPHPPLYYSPPLSSPFSASLSWGGGDSWYLWCFAEKRGTEWHRTVSQPISVRDSCTLMCLRETEVQREKSNGVREGSTVINKSIIQEGGKNKRQQKARQTRGRSSQGKRQEGGNICSGRLTDNNLCTWFMEVFANWNPNPKYQPLAIGLLSFITAILSALSSPSRVEWLCFAYGQQVFACGPHYCHLAELHYGKWVKETLESWGKKKKKEKKRRDGATIFSRQVWIQSALTKGGVSVLHSCELASRLERARVSQRRVECVQNASPFSFIFFFFFTTA